LLISSLFLQIFPLNQLWHTIVDTDSQATLPRYMPLPRQRAQRLRACRKTMAKTDGKWESQQETLGISSRERVLASFFCRMTLSCGNLGWKIPGL
jgi:hypothetical protein